MRFAEKVPEEKLDAAASSFSSWRDLRTSFTSENRRKKNSGNSDRRGNSNGSGRPKPEPDDDFDNDEKADKRDWLASLERAAGAAAELKSAIRMLQGIKMTEERWELLEPIGEEVSIDMKEFYALNPKHKHLRVV
jgi:hypothetical protein